METIETEKTECLDGNLEVNIYDENESLIDISDYTIKNPQNETIVCKAQIFYTI